MPTLYMMVGVPGSGKTTWVGNRKLTLKDYTVGSDYVIDEIADLYDMTYTEAFPLVIKFAEKVMYQEIERAIEAGDNIYWDQTNISKKSRAEKLAKIPSDYRKVAVYFKVPDDLDKRLASRKDRTVPAHVIDVMVEMIEKPTLDEGFDEIIEI